MQVLRLGMSDSFDIRCDTNPVRFSSESFHSLVPCCKEVVALNGGLPGVSMVVRCNFLLQGPRYILSAQNAILNSELVP